MELKQGDLENLIINALWDLEGDDPTTTNRVYVSDVQEHIRTTSRKWAYTTVKTVMDRLVDKDLALRHKEGKRFYYQSLVSRAESGRQAVGKLVRQYFQGDVEALLGCVAQLRLTLGDDFATQPARKVAPVTVTTTAAALSREFQAHLIKRSYENAPAGERFVRRTPANTTSAGGMSQGPSAAPGGATAASFRAAASSYHDDVPVLIGAGRVR